DNALSNCTDPQSGQRINKQDRFLAVLAQSNWRTCNLAAQNGFSCIDSFAQYMGADYDSNGDGQIDSDGLRYQPGESEADYVTRITVTLRPTIRDSNTHFVNPSTSYDYLLSDDTHPTHYTSSTIGINIFTGSGSGSGAPTFSGGQIVGGKNPEWNKWGHERIEWGVVGAAFRRTETPPPQVRSTNTGISAVIDAARSIVVQAGVGTRAVLAAAISPQA